MMKIKIGVIFLAAVFIPTAFLAYFGLLAVRSERSIVEKSIRQKYEAIADVVEGEIKAGARGAQNELLEDPKYMEVIIGRRAYVFKDEVVIFNKEGRIVTGTQRSEKPALLRPINGLPYAIAVYEKYPSALIRIEEKKQNLAFYLTVIYLAALTILGGSLFTLSALSRQWQIAQARNEFAEHLSHELRRPLTSIGMFSEMLKSDRVPNEEKRRQYYEIISSESEKLTHLANNILDFSKIDTGRKDYNFKREDIVKILTDTVERFKDYMMENSRLVILTPNHSLESLIVNIDADAISRAVMNLLINADKYSPAGKEIKISIIREDDKAVIEVSDEGVGISSREQKKIFRKFYRVPRKESDEIEGSGLGLMLVKCIAEAHGGWVRVESEEGKGSTFSLVLPM